MWPRRTTPLDGDLLPGNTAANPRRLDVLRPTLVLMLALAAAPIGCKQKAQPAALKAKEIKASPPEKVVAAIRNLKTTLGARLKAEIAQSGPEAAVEACRLDAAKFTQAQQQAGLRIGRTSHKLRNPANKAPAWAEEAVASGAGRVVSEVKRRRVYDLGGGHLGYVEAMGVGAVCLTCHGPAEGISPPLAERIAKAYPDDKATGFQEGDVRGWFWVEYGASR